jgi:uncharacterized membrane protein
VIDRRQLESSLSDWQSAGIITADQAAAIRTRNAVSTPVGVATDESGKDRLVSVISIIGAVVLGLGVILLVAANWDGIEPAQRVVLLTVSMFGTYFLGWKLHSAGDHPQIATAILLVGTLIFGASIFLIGQTYNVQAHDPTAFLVLAIVSGAMALIVESRPHGGVAAVSLATWWVYEVAYLLDANGDDNYLAAIAVAALGGGAIYGTGQAVSHVRPLGDPFKIAGFIILAGALMVLSLAHRVGEIISAPHSGLSYTLISTVVALAAAGALYVTKRQQHSQAEAVGLAVMSVALFFAALDTDELLASFIANIALLALIFGGIAIGVARRDKTLYGLSVAVAVIDIVVRYFDFLFNTVSGGLFFVGAGALLLGIGWLISRTRKVWKEQAAQ